MSFNKKYTGNTTGETAGNIAGNTKATKNFVVRFAGDSGDGIQLLGKLFTSMTTIYKGDFHTFPDYPAEIRAPQGSKFGVSAFQIQLGTDNISTHGDRCDLLIAFNPASLVTNIKHCKKSSLIIINTDEFSKSNLKRVNLDENYKDQLTLDNFETLNLPLNDLTLNALSKSELGRKDKLLCKNFFILGLIKFAFTLDESWVNSWFNKKLISNPNLTLANETCLKAGYNHGETIEFILSLPVNNSINPCNEENYSEINGANAIALGIIAGAHLCQRKIVFTSYPITPASPILHSLVKKQNSSLVVWQAEDEIAAICAAIGASFAGSIGITSTSGPGIALMSEAMSMALTYELPLLIINSQRAGPSTGMPTKVEQADLFQSVFGRNGDAPIPVIAASYPDSCFDTTIEAIKIAVKFMTPVILLSDGYLNNVSVPWKVPNLDDDIYDKISNNFSNSDNQKNDNNLFLRNKNNNARKWLEFGNPQHIHRLGTLEKDLHTNNISYDAKNHQAMTDMRFNKINLISKQNKNIDFIVGSLQDDTLIIGWGSTFGTIKSAVDELIKKGFKIAYIHLSWIYPLPKNLYKITKKFNKVIMPELNNGQCALFLKSQLLINIVSICKSQGQPFTQYELISQIKEIIT